MCIESIENDTFTLRILNHINGRTKYSSIKQKLVKEGRDVSVDEIKEKMQELSYMGLLEVKKEEVEIPDVYEQHVKKLVENNYVKHGEKNG